MDNRPFAQLLHDALAPLPWPYHLQDAPGTEEIYLTAYMLPSSVITHASNAPRRSEDVAQVSIYSRRPVVDEIRVVVAALRREGLRVSQYGAQGFDSQTQLYNSPIIVRRAIIEEVIDHV